MILINTKGYIVNFKNFIISNYVFTFKKLFFNNLVYITIETSKKSFFLASFLINCFYFFNKIKFFFKKKLFHILLSSFFFFFFFNLFIFSMYKVNKFYKKINTSLYMRFKLVNPLIIPNNNFFLYKKNYIKTLKPIFLKFRYTLEKKLKKFLFFYINFFQIPFFNQQTLLKLKSKCKN